MCSVSRERKNRDQLSYNSETDIFAVDPNLVYYLRALGKCDLAVDEIHKDVWGPLAQSVERRA